MAKHRIVLIAVLLLAAAVRVYIEQSTGFQFDDAWITYRYAENLAAGNGFVYNSGEYVEGSTAPLLVLLLSLFPWLGISIPNSSLALSILASIALLYLVWRICEPRIRPFGAFIAVVVVGFSPSLVLAPVSGMETTLFVALLLLACLAYRDDRPLLLGSAVAALALTRIDGLLFLPALVATELWRWYRDPGGTDRSIRIALLCRSVGTAALLLLPWIVFALYYFGSVVPNSIWAKLALYRHAGTDVTARSMIIEAMLTLGNQASRYWRCQWCSPLWCGRSSGPERKRSSRSGSWHMPHSFYRARFTCTPGTIRPFRRLQASWSCCALVSGGIWCHGTPICRSLVGQRV
jgi:hypothetical protein